MKTEVLSNFEAVAQLAGVYMGISDGVNDKRYLSKVITKAHEESADEFDLAAASYAATGKIRHMYEYGVSGITEGIPKYTDPTAQEARLWVHKLRGTGTSKDITFSFRPAVNRNPAPTVANTGVQSKFLRKLSQRKYVFWNRAFVLEKGVRIHINAINNDSLFVPFRGKSRNPKYKDGFVWWNTKRKGPIVSTPGESVKGSFEEFWIGWWSKAGTESMNAEMSKKIDSDISTARARQTNIKAMEPVQSVDIALTVSGARRRTKTLFGKYL